MKPSCGKSAIFAHIFPKALREKNHLNIILTVPLNTVKPLEQIITQAVPGFVWLVFRLYLEALGENIFQNFSV